MSDYIEPSEAEVITLRKRVEELEAANRGLVRLNEATQARADSHWETLRSIRHIAEDTGDLARIIQWVSDAAGGYAETADATLAAEMDRRAAAETKLTIITERSDAVGQPNEELGVKLEKAVEALEKLARLGNGGSYGNSDGNMIARATLAELTNPGGWDQPQ